MQGSREGNCGAEGGGKYIDSNRGKDGYGEERAGRMEKRDGGPALWRPGILTLLRLFCSSLSAQVIEIEGVTKSYEGRLLIDNFSCSIPPGAVVGIVGPNGTGKSTLFRSVLSPP